MNLDPDVLAAKPRSRVLEWVYFANEQTMFETYRAEEAAFRAGRTH